MRDALASELNALSYRLLAIAEHGRSYDFSFETLRRALSEVVAHFPVYRTYIGPGRISGADREHLDVAVREAKAGSEGDPSVFDFISDVVAAGSPGRRCPRLSPTGSSSTRGP